METNKITIIGLVIIIAVLLVLICLTVIPTMQKEDCNIEITSSELLKDNENLTVKLSDSKNNPLTNKSIRISLNNSENSQEYAVKTDSNGIATLTLSEDNVGLYNVTCTFEGDDTYRESSTSKEITIEKSVVQATESTSAENPIESNRPKNDPNYKGYTPNHESEVVNGWNPADHETYRERMDDGTVKIHYDDDYFRLVDENGYVITYGYGG
ncbi:Ig-like domain-containing protein [Methanobrevibacter sp.]|uniref:Ig-like domain-containing protein n=1 Tax=Methanobrevibacter sp. TaxID=66852 RepID=UPI00388FD4D7